MTVRELIKKLQDLPEDQQDLDVVSDDDILIGSVELVRNISGGYIYLS